MNKLRRLYIPPYPGELIRKTRQLRRLKQRELARILGLDQSRLSKIERGLAWPSEREKPLLEYLRISMRDFEQTMAGNKTLDRKGCGFGGTASQHYIPPTEVDSLARLSAARKAYPEAMAAIEDRLARRSDRNDVQCFLRDCPFESGFETLATSKILELPSITGWASPLAWGFRQLSVIDKESKLVVGDLKFPAIYLTELRVILIPQVTVNVTGLPRLDYLAGIRGSFDMEWVDLEFDGPGHNGSRDRERQLAHRLREVRFNEDAVLADSFHDKLTEGLLGASLKLRRAG